MQGKFFTLAQDIVTNFNTNTENWVRIGSAKIEVSQSSETLVMETKAIIEAFSFLQTT